MSCINARGLQRTSPQIGKLDKEKVDISMRSFDSQKGVTVSSYKGASLCDSVGFESSPISSLSAVHMPWCSRDGLTLFDDNNDAIDCACNGPLVTADDPCIGAACANGKVLY